MKEFDQLNNSERNELLMAPVYFSLLAANEDGRMDKKEEKKAIELSHIKTFSSPPALKDFYRQVDANFMENLESLDHKLPQGKVEREIAIKDHLKKMKPILDKLDPDFANQLRDSLKAYTEHIAKTHLNVLPSFLDPFFWVL